METTKQRFLLVGVSNTGSGSLTFPEDFEFVGVYDTEEDVKLDADERNGEMSAEIDESGARVQEDPDTVYHVIPVSDLVHWTKKSFVTHSTTS